MSEREERRDRHVHMEKGTHEEREQSGGRYGGKVEGQAGGR